jgi:putative ABC transport system substrate-binding protein
MFSKSSLFILAIFLGLGLFIATKMLSNPLKTSQDKPFYKIGLIKILDHPALDRTQEGVIDYFKEASPESVINSESAQADLQVANQIIQKFTQDKVDVIITLGTTVSQIAMKKTKKIPIVFGSVTDPLVSGLVESLDKPGSNVTGVSNFNPNLIEESLSFFKKILPNLKILGIIYNPGESNSVILLENTHKVAKRLGIEIKTLPAQDTNEAVFAAKNFAGSLDAIFINNDNTALSAIRGIVEAAYKIPVFCSDVDTFDKGVLAVFGPDQYVIGQEVGKMSLALMKKEIFPQSTPVVFPDKNQLMINKEKAKELGIVIEADLVQYLK